MNEVPVLQSARLKLREWRNSDRVPFAALNADLEVMRHFPAPLTREMSDDFCDHIREVWCRGFGLWAVERLDDGKFVGFIGLSEPSWIEHFTPCIEIGWRLGRTSWGQGFATEGATEVLSWAKQNVTFPRDEVVSFTVVRNTRSRRVMERLGFHHDPADDFDHPLLPDWPSRRHVLYRKHL